ncbi:MAG TPA: hypothetical protein PK036_14025, partial [Geobacteraceae bacterium]|nr:hypothetical protein [Geobacteraceae bacterium]
KSLAIFRNNIPLALLTGGQAPRGRELSTREVILSEYLTGAGNTAPKVMADVYRTITEEEGGRDWLKDSRQMEKVITDEVSDPWGS